MGADADAEDAVSESQKFGISNVENALRDGSYEHSMKSGLV